jgi:hypothetical protein
MEKRMKFNITKLILTTIFLLGGISVSANAESFSEAFAKAKANGLAQFSYKGNLFSTQTAEEAANKTYGPFPTTVKGYTGTKTNSVSYSGQIARHVLHDSLKKLSSKGDAATMMSYFGGSEENLSIIAPASKDGFPVKQKNCKRHFQREKSFW